MAVQGVLVVDARAVLASLSAMEWHVLQIVATRGHYSLASPLTDAEYRAARTLQTQAAPLLVCVRQGTEFRLSPLGEQVLAAARQAGGR